MSADSDVSYLPKIADHYKSSTFDTVYCPRPCLEDAQNATKYFKRGSLIVCMNTLSIGKMSLWTFAASTPIMVADEVG